MKSGITKEIIADFIQNNEIELSSTHRKLCLPVINRMYKKMSFGIKFPAISVEKNLICDGHHRYIASILANFQRDRIPGNITSDITMVSWDSVSFEEENWDYSESLLFRLGLIETSSLNKIAKLLVVLVPIRRLKYS